MQESEHIPDWSLVQQYLRASPSIFFCWVAETDWPVKYVSENISQFGYRAEEFISGQKKFSEIVHPDDLDRVTREVEEYTAKRLNSFTQEYRVLTREGDICWIDDRTVIQCNAAGEVTHYLGIITDITNEKNTETALKLSQEKYRALVETTEDFVWEVNRDGLYTYCSPQVESLLGYTPEEMLGKTPFEFMAAEDAETVAGTFAEIAVNERAFSFLENINLHRDGREIVIETSGVPFFDAGGRLAGYRGIDRNITEQKRAEKAAQRHQRDMAHVMRLSTMGEMATGMAHELNQPLAAIVMYCGTAMSLVDSLSSPPQQLGEMLVRVKEQAHRAGDIIRHLREFVSKEGTDKEPFDIDQLIRDVITFLKWEVQERGVKIEHCPGSLTRKVTANKIQVEQVVVNLVRNSLEAFEHAKTAEGRVVIQTRLLPTGMVEVRVTDNGPGIDATIADKIFDQFQTSKETGMGIGLSLSRSIIEVYGGKLWVDKGHHNGAAFGFELPVIE